jgi:hypothetical protein
VQGGGQKCAHQFPVQQKMPNARENPPGKHPDRGRYAVCLGLIENGQVVVGVMGCPNLPVDPKRPEGDKG